ncbi:hypothetical protein [Kribbella solani]|uniref:Uncharacterized protein n=1 Tax=Kribbella solani TaxID=236067 RepID=A0A841DFD1_9ACTN|nr:hypothetical protein [Kribbella solani]MBB5977243.1 hypothetical protein [Kribbella solani]
MSVSPPPPPIDRDTLLADYIASREDERSFQTTQVALASLALTTLGLLAGLVGRYVLPNSHQNDIPPGLLVLAPMVPLALFGMFVQAGAQATLRTHYLRDLEQQLAQPTADPAATPSPSFIRIVGALVGLKHGHAIYRAITVMLITIAMSAFIVILILIAINVPGPWAALMTVSYSFTILLLVHLTWSTTAAGLTFYNSARERLQIHTSGATGPDGQLVKYLALPRPVDLQKGLYYLAGFLVALTYGAADRTFGLHLLALIWGWVVLEFLAYQARYQWNDIRGFAGEATHPMATARKRLPDSGGDPIRQSAQVALARVGAALVLALGAPAGTRTALLVGLVAIFVLAVLYEKARADDSVAGVIILVAIGYPLRFCLGLAIAGFDWADGGLVVAAIGAVAFAAVGWSTVGLTWALEAEATPQASRSRHLEFLWRNAGLGPGPTAGPPLARRMRPVAVPNLAQFTACVLGTLLGTEVVRRDWSWLVIAMLAVTAAATLLLIGFGIRKTLTGVVVGCALVSLSGLSVWYSESWRAGWVPLFFGVFTAFYLGFRSQTYAGLSTAPKDMLANAKSLAGAVETWFKQGKPPSQPPQPNTPAAP